MNLAITYSRASIGINAPIVTVETHISNGLPALNIVGLPETVVKESKDRVRSAIITSHFEFPMKRITVNLAPADLPKQGGRYDLPIALGILAASNQIPSDEFGDYEFAGELALSGQLRAISSILPLALATKTAGRNLIFPIQNVPEAELIENIQLFPANHLLDVCRHFLKKTRLSPHTTKTMPVRKFCYQDLKEVKGQHHAKRALEIAAAGQHSLLLIGPPGVGKTLLSNCLPGILPPLDEEEASELAAIQSVAGIKPQAENWRKRPFRSPHHSSSSFALIGGGNPPKPGEISLAHHGVLFLDEFPEFKRQALEALREPLEAGSISISRATIQVKYPAKFQLIAAMNPCPCGQYSPQQTDCTCLPDQVRRYQSRISGPLLDRIDLQTELQTLPTSLLTSENINTESSSEVALRVFHARNKQLKRSQKPNAYLTPRELLATCHLGKQESTFLENFITKKKLSARVYHRALKVARTIADLDQSCKVNLDHLKEAFSYRMFEFMKKIG
jgi:magnesium chelatase family protein